MYLCCVDNNCEKNYQKHSLHLCSKKSDMTFLVFSSLVLCQSFFHFPQNLLPNVVVVRKSMRKNTIYLYTILRKRKFFCLLLLLLSQSACFRTRCNFDILIHLCFRNLFILILIFTFPLLHAILYGMEDIPSHKLAKNTSGR